MAIQIDAEKKIFTLETDHTMYQMQADAYGVLRHLWYGAKTGCDMSYLQDYPDVGFSGNIYAAGNDRTYSLDTLPLEYAGAGVGDFRVPAVAAVHADGSSALDLRYYSHTVKPGKYGIEGLPAVYAAEDEAETLEVVLRDTASAVEVTLLYAVLPALDLVTRCARIRNLGETPVTLTKAASLCLDISREWVHFHGRHAMERQMERRLLFHGIQEIGSTRGTSSHHQNPTVLLCTPDCTETAGACIGAALVYSGSHQTRLECDQLGQVRMVMGIHPDLFRWELKAGETFSTPEVMLSYSDTGLETLSHHFHQAIREHICRGKYQLAERPVLINNWEATYFGFDTEKILHIAEEAARLGVDMLVLDDGWFGKRDDDCSGLGDWFVNETKLSGGLHDLVEKIKGMGMRFGIWFEPEMISEDSDLYRKHPDWAIRIPDRAPMRSRYQLVLDMANPEVQEYLFRVMSDVLHSADISYVNDRMRPRVDGKGSYDRIVPMYKKLVDQRGEKEYYVRGTYTKYNLDFSDDVFALLDAGFDQISVEPVIADPKEPYAITEADLPRIFEEYERLMQKILDYEATGKKFNFFHFMLDLDQGPCAIKRLRGCGCGNEYVSINPDGVIYQCHLFVGESYYKLGNVDDGTFNREMKSDFAKTHIYSKPDCRNCWARFYCSGGCNANNYQYSGDVHKAYKLSCEIEKKRLECAIVLKAIRMDRDAAKQESAE